MCEWSVGPWVKSYCGHGIGTLFHCAPNIPHYAKNKAVGQMKEGHVFTIEPMINAGDWKDATWPDGWTAVTKDGTVGSATHSLFRLIRSRLWYI